MNFEERIKTMLGIEKQKQSAIANKPDVVPSTTPFVDVFENAHEFLVVADLPGVSQGAANITIDQDKLLLDANGAVRRYERHFTIPPSVDAENVSAEMKAGVLTLRLPKREPYKPRQIQVKNAS